MSGRVLVARLDSAGDVLLTGPAIRAVAAGGRDVVLLCGPRGRSAADLLPGVSRVLEWRAPWIDPDPRPVNPPLVIGLVARLMALRPAEALIFTSFHQSPLPLALVLRLSGVPRISAICEDYPGSLLDLRHHVSAVPEPERALSLAAAAGYTLPPDDDGRLRVRAPLPDVTGLVGEPGYVVVHPGASVPARAWPASHARDAARMLTAEGFRVVVTGSAAERALTAYVSDGRTIDLGGRTTFAQLAAVLGGASAVVVGNTGPAHLAAAVGTSVVSLFAPTVSATQWAPYRVPTVLLGDQAAPCAGTRARTCPVPGHPCLASVAPDDAVKAVYELAGVTA